MASKPEASSDCGDRLQRSRKLVIFVHAVNQSPDRGAKHFFSSRRVKRVYLFGSYARNQADATSDIDILLELDHKEPIGMSFFSFKEELEESLKVRVDVLTTDGLSPHVKPYVDKEKLLIYERPAA